MSRVKKYNPDKEMDQNDISISERLKKLFGCNADVEEDVIQEIQRSKQINVTTEPQGIIKQDENVSKVDDVSEDNKIESLYDLLNANIDPSYSSYIEMLKFNNFKEEVKRKGGLQNYLDSLFHTGKLNINTYINYSVPVSENIDSFNFFEAIKNLGEQIYLEKKYDGVKKILAQDNIKEIIKNAKSKFSGIKNSFYNFLVSVQHQLRNFKT